MRQISELLAPLPMQAQPAVSRLQLRWDFVNTAAAVALLAIGCATIAVFFFRRRTSDKTLIYSGVFCVLYAIRLLTTVLSFHRLFDVSTLFWVHLNWVITCVIIIPLSLFLYQLVGDRLRLLLRWAVAAQALFAIFGIGADALGVNLSTLYAANSIMTLLTIVIPLPFLWRKRSRRGGWKHLPHEVRVFIVGFNIWLLFIVHANLLGLGIIRGLNVEFVGFLAFMACLGYVAANRTFANEERLAAINTELEIARGIQAYTLPQKIPTLAGLQIAARYEPMSAVAGDFYDFLCVDENRIGILVADVTGHGVPAALIASMLKVAFAGQADRASDPASLLDGLNRALCGKFEEHFVTAAYLFVDLEQRLMRYSAAGHPPMLMMSRGEREVREVTENGLMLGMFPEAVYASLEIKMQSGDRCLLYTDGVFEAKNAAQEEYGRARCREFLLAHRETAVGDVAKGLFEEIAKFSGLNAGGTQDDDITLLVLDIG